jgi:catechol 2,3-dioxygenase-like lactoylglutathione lyase family enzyme
MSIESSPRPTPYCPPTQQLILEIYVCLLEKSTAFYKSLGFKLDWLVPSFFAQVSWQDGCLLFLKQKAAQNSSINPSPAHSTSAGNVRIMIPNVDAKYRECIDKLGCQVVQEVGDRKFVLRDFVVRDPDGFGVRFGSFLEGRGRREQEGPDDEML